MARVPVSCRPGPGFAISLGAVVGALAMTRSELIVVSVLLVLPLVLSVREVDLRRRLVWIVLAGVACLVVIAPWAVYNSTRFDKQVPFSTGFGVAMLTGNCAPMHDGSMIGYANLGCVAFVPHVSTDYSVADGEYRRQALKFIGKHKSQATIVALAWCRRTFGFFRPVQQMHIEAQDRNSPLWVFRVGFAMYWLMLPFAVVGFVSARRRRIPVYPLLAFAATALIAVLPTIGAVRYRAPAEIALVSLAAAGLETVLSVAAPTRTRMGTDVSRRRAKSPRTGRRPILDRHASWDHANRFRLRLGLIALAGLAFRIFYDIANRHRGILQDGFRYHYGAISLADGKGFVAPLVLAFTNKRIPDTGHPPAWTIVLAGATKLGLRTWLEHAFVASVVGTVTIVMVGPRHVPRSTGSGRP